MSSISIFIISLSVYKVKKESGGHAVAFEIKRVFVRLPIVAAFTSKGYVTGGMSAAFADRHDVFECQWCEAFAVAALSFLFLLYLLALSWRRVISNASFACTFFVSVVALP